MHYLKKVPSISICTKPIVKWIYSNSKNIWEVLFESSPFTNVKTFGELIWNVADMKLSSTWTLTLGYFDLAPDLCSPNTIMSEKYHFLFQKWPWVQKPSQSAILLELILRARADFISFSKKILEKSALSTPNKMCLVMWTLIHGPPKTSHYSWHNAWILHPAWSSGLESQPFSLHCAQRKKDSLKYRERRRGCSCHEHEDVVHSEVHRGCAFPQFFAQTFVSIYWLCIWRSLPRLTSFGYLGWWKRKLLMLRRKRARNTGSELSWTNLSFQGRKARAERV